MFTETEITVIAFVVIALLIAYSTRRTRTDSDGRIKDESVNKSNVISVLNNFTVEREDRLKDGYTEKSIQKQLKPHLLKHFVHVTDEYGIEGLNVTKINFDIGNGKIGVELKLAKSLLRITNLQRLVGQIEDFTNNKYNDNNLIIVVYGEPEHTKERTYLKEIQAKIEKKGATYLYYEIPLKKKKQKV